MLSTVTSYPTTLERAFELARSGDCQNIPELRKRLKAEGHSGEQVSGPVLIRQLRNLLFLAKKNPA
jgi:hypothetical protein